jgi:2-oxoglutarate dehydrogenase E2 component (dihydrolipoamide succinyltransferase)
MGKDIRVPSLGESVTEATVGQWFKRAGDAVTADEPLVELETDKVTVEVPAPASGVLSEILVKAGDTVAVGTLLGAIVEGGVANESKADDGKPAMEPLRGPEVQVLKPGVVGSGAEIPKPRPQPAALEREPAPREEVSDNGHDDMGHDEMPPSPAARKLLAESGMAASEIAGSGRRGQVLKQDVLKQDVVEQDRSKREAPIPIAAGGTGSAAAALLAREPKPKPPTLPRAPIASDDQAREERVRMTRLRQTIAKRLKEAQDVAAMLTTFNDVDMSGVMEFRRTYREAFEKKHGVKLGLMGFFVKAAVQALKDIPAVNAEIDGTDIVYKNYYHIGVAVGTERGLVVPVLRDADRMSLAEIEMAIADFGKRAREGKLGV